MRGIALVAATLVSIATIFYRLVEKWSLDSAYFAVVTIATVGYGDFAQTALGKIFTIGYIFAGIGIFVAAVTAVAQAVLRNRTSAG